MKQYDLTIEDGVITWIESTNEQGDPFNGILYIPKDATAFDIDTWVFLGCQAQGIVVEAENPMFSSAHNCLLSKDGKTLIKVCKTSDVSKLTGLETIGMEAFDEWNVTRKEFKFQIPRGVKSLGYRAMAMNADEVHIIVPSSVQEIKRMAFMIYGNNVHIEFEGDPTLEVGAFGTEAEAADSNDDIYRTMPSTLFPKVNNLTVSCKKDSSVFRYCQKYHIPTRS